MGLGSTLFLTSCLPSKAMATVVAVETAGGAGKEGVPHREPSPGRDVDFPEVIP